MLLIRVFLTVCSALVFDAYPVHAQPLPQNIDSLLIGNWSGSSVCQVRNSNCKKENLLYHIKAGGQPGKYNIIMNRIVQGRKEEMGTLFCTWYPSTNKLIADNYNGEYSFTVISETRIDGVMYYRKALYRTIRVTKLQ